MRPGYLVDTDWAIHRFKGHPPIRERLDELCERGLLALSAVSLAELYEGVYYSRDPAQSETVLKDFLRGVLLLDIDIETCQLFGKERGRLLSQGKLIADFDLMIGVTALQHDLTLLTNNRKHFENIEGLRIESLV